MKQALDHLRAVGNRLSQKEDRDKTMAWCVSEIKWLRMHIWILIVGVLLLFVRSLW